MARGGVPFFIFLKKNQVSTVYYFEGGCMDFFIFLDFEVVLCTTLEEFCIVFRCFYKILVKIKILSVIDFKKWRDGSPIFYKKKDTEVV